MRASLPRPAVPNKLQRAQTNLKNEVTLVSTKNQCAVVF